MANEWLWDRNGKRKDKRKLVWWTPYLDNQNTGEERIGTPTPTAITGTAFILHYGRPGPGVMLEVLVGGVCLTMEMLKDSQEAEEWAETFCMGFMSAEQSRMDT